MGTIRNFIALLRGNLKCTIKKVLNTSRFIYNPFLRINSDVNIRIDSKSRMSLGKGVLINSRTVISSIDGGNLVIGEMVGVNCNSMIMCHESITIGDNTIMGPGVLIYDHDHDFNSTEGVKRNHYKTTPVSIGRNCWIGAGTIILRGSTIGDNCLIAAGSIIKGEIPTGSIVIQKRDESINKRIST